MLIWRQQGYPVGPTGTSRMEEEEEEEEEERRRERKRKAYSKLTQ